MGYFYVLATAFFGIVTWWTGSKAWDEFNMGDITGSASLQDDSSPEKIKIEASFKGAYAKEITLDATGKFKAHLKAGAYTLKFSSPGYETLTQPISIQDGETQNPHQTLKVVPKNVKTKFIDAQGRPYANIKLNIGLGAPPVAMSFDIQLDENGEATTPELKFGEYLIYIGEPVRDPGFLWINGTALKSYPSFLLNGYSDSYTLTLRKLVASEASNSNSSRVHNLGSDKYIGKKFTTATAFDICGAFLEIGFGEGEMAKKLDIRKDQDGSPASKAVASQEPSPHAAVLSLGTPGIYANFCIDSDSFSLPAGDYWLVANYSEPIDRIHYLGIDGSTPLKSSRDGINWNDLTLSGGGSTVGFALIE